VPGPLRWSGAGCGRRCCLAHTPASLTPYTHSQGSRAAGTGGVGFRQTSMYISLCAYSRQHPSIGHGSNDHIRRCSIWVHLVVLLCESHGTAHVCWTCDHMVWHYTGTGPAKQPHMRCPVKHVFEAWQFIRPQVQPCCCMWCPAAWLTSGLRLPSCRPCALVGCPPVWHTLRSRRQLCAHNQHKCAYNHHMCACNQHVCASVEPVHAAGLLACIYVLEA
jgi:hypothetical protein